MLEVEFFTLEELVERSPLEVDYVSLFNPESHGPPALVAPGRVAGRAERPIAKVDDKVLYINTKHVPAFAIERLHDDH